MSSGGHSNKKMENFLTVFSVAYALQGDEQKTAGNGAGRGSRSEISSISAQRSEF
jgi:hypothetical protein